MTRLDSSARDYAIALVAVRRLHGFSDALSPGGTDPGTRTAADRRGAR
jgi:hypothetical protein